MRSYIIALLFLVGSQAAVAGPIESKLRHQVDSAHAVYLKGNFSSRQEAMLSLSKILESTDANTRNSAVGPNTLAVTYIRLGILAKESKDLKLAAQYFVRGIESYNQNKRKMTLEELVESTYDLDNFARSYSQ